MIFIQNVAQCLNISSS